jgi:cob(I)alamin adenosyltransferase
MPNPNESTWISHHQLDGELAPVRQALADINGTLNLMKKIHQVTSEQLDLLHTSLKTTQSMVSIMKDSIFPTTSNKETNR